MLDKDKIMMDFFYKKINQMITDDKIIIDEININNDDGVYRLDVKFCDKLGDNFNFNYEAVSSAEKSMDGLNSIIDKMLGLVEKSKTKNTKCCKDYSEKCLNDEYTISIDDIDIDADIDKIEFDYPKDNISPEAQHFKDRIMKQGYTKIFSSDENYQRFKDRIMEQEYLMVIETENGDLDGDKNVVYLKESDFKFNPRLDLDNFKVIMDSKMNILINSNDIYDVVMYINYLLNFYFRVKSPFISKKENALNEDGYKVFIEPVLSRIADTVMKKYDDYGKTNLVNSEKFDIKPKNGILLRINDKINRIHNLLRPERIENFESVEDSFEDAIGYCLLIIALGVMNEDSSNY